MKDVLGVSLFTPAIHRDHRGRFAEWFHGEFGAAQGNLSESVQGVIRGMHYSIAGQAKYVTCVLGKIADVVLDVRDGSPHFGEWRIYHLDDQRRECLLIPGGLAHGFQVLSTAATVLYLTSTPHSPQREFAVHPLDPAVNIWWPDAGRVLSERDEAAPTLATAQAQGFLPRYPGSDD